MSGLINLSNDTALAPLSDVVRDVVRASEGAKAEIFVAGAFARDLWLQFAHYMGPVRATADIDCAVQCEDWEAFHRISAALVASGFHAPSTKRPHRFVHSGGISVDLVPFGGIERRDRTIAWPPDGSHVMNLVGFAEAFRSTVTFRLPGDVAVPVASLAALAMLKLLAWRDRRLVEPGKDARDLHLILRTYFEAGNQERAFVEISELADRDDFDIEHAGAELLGRDLGQQLSEELRAELIRTLEVESSPQGELRLATEMHRNDAESARKLLAGFQSGLNAIHPIASRRGR